MEFAPAGAPATATGVCRCRLASQRHLGKGRGRESKAGEESWVRSNAAQPTLLPQRSAQTRACGPPSLLHSLQSCLFLSIFLQHKHHHTTNYHKQPLRPALSPVSRQSPDSLYLLRIATSQTPIRHHVEPGRPLRPLHPQRPGRASTGRQC